MGSSGVGKDRFDVAKSCDNRPGAGCVLDSQARLLSESPASRRFSKGRIPQLIYPTGDGAALQPRLAKTSRRRATPDSPRIGRRLGIVPIALRLPGKHPATECASIGDSPPCAGNAGASARAWNPLEARSLLSGYNPSQVVNAYGIDAISFNSPSGSLMPGNGSGETIALIEAYHDPSLAADLHAFDRAYSLPDPQLAVINQAGVKTNSTWASEESLDVEWAHAFAPGANILVVEAVSQALPDLGRGRYGAIHAWRRGHIDELGFQRVGERDRV